MPLAETARLLASLDIKDGLTPAVKTMTGSLDRLDTRIGKSSSRAHKAGQQIGTGIKAGAVILTGAIAGIGALLLSSAKEGQEAQKVQQLYAKAIANSGKVSADYVKQLDAQQKALLDLTGTDDEVIKGTQTQLIQMGLTGAQVKRVTPLIYDLVASGKDLESSTKAVGKATLGSNTALTRLGIIVPKGADAVGELERRFKGTAGALSGGLDVRLKVFNERLANVREEAGIKLLPALTRIVDVVGSRLVPAFGKFVDSVLPLAIAGLDKLSDFLEKGGGVSAIDSLVGTMKTAAPILADAAQKTLTVVKAAADIFGSLPPEIQALAVAGFAVNKLTGGLVTNIAGGLISAVISSFKGLMNVNAAVVNVNGPVAGLPGVPGAAAPKGGPGVLGFGVASVAAAVGIAAAGALGDAIDPAGAAARASGTALGQRDPRRFNKEGIPITNVIKITDPIAKPILKSNRALDALKTSVGTGNTAIRTGAMSTKGAIDAAKSAQVGAIDGLKYQLQSLPTPIVNVNVDVSATTVNKTSTVQTRYGPSSGSRTYNKARDSPT